jgi:V-type H+-transporting ATPase subunit G
MSSKSQELISKLLAAEDEAEKIIKNARDMRSQKMKEVKSAAEEELAPFRMKEE